MAALDDKAQDVSSEGDSKMVEMTSPEIDEKGKDEKAGGFIIVAFIVGLIVSLIIGWILFPKLLYSKKKQPIDFNHQVHTDSVEDGCESCHYFRDDGSFSGIPKLELCIECHEEVQGEDPEEQIFVEKYVSKGKEVPWLIYSKQPPCVYFSHAPHVRLAKMDCITCHGQIGESTHSRIYEKNRITGYSRDIWGKNIAGFKKHSWDRMKMDDCSECHVKNNVNQGSVQTQKGGCFVCHH